MVNGKRFPPLCRPVRRAADAEPDDVRITGHLVRLRPVGARASVGALRVRFAELRQPDDRNDRDHDNFYRGALRDDRRRSEEHTSELQSLMRISYAVFCLKTK